MNHIGFIFSQPQLLDGVTLRENALLPAQWHSKPHQQAAAIDADRWFRGRAYRALGFENAAVARVQWIITVTDGVVPVA